MGRIISATLGHIVPRYRLFRDAIRAFDDIDAMQPIKAKTLGQHRLARRAIDDALGDRSIASIMSADIVRLIRAVHQRSPQLSQRVLHQLALIFDQAISDGWVERNPARAVRRLPAPVVRSRLSLRRWQLMLQVAEAEGQPWVPHLLKLALVTGLRRHDLQKMAWADIYLGHLHVVHQKTGAMVAMPLELTLEAASLSLESVLDDCRGYAPMGATVLRRRDGRPLGLASLSTRFRDTLKATGYTPPEGRSRPSLHECRSLSERLYRAQGINTRVLLGHKRWVQTDEYNDDRGLSLGKWQYVTISADQTPFNRYVRPGKLGVDPPARTQGTQGDVGGLEPQRRAATHGLGCADGRAWPLG